jgi:hypothetical protein
VFIDVDGAADGGVGADIGTVVVAPSGTTASTEVDMTVASIPPSVVDGADTSEAGEGSKVPDGVGVYFEKMEFKVDDGVDGYVCGWCKVEREKRTSALQQQQRQLERKRKRERSIQEHNIVVKRILQGPSVHGGAHASFPLPMMPADTLFEIFLLLDPLGLSSLRMLSYSLRTEVDSRNDTWKALVTTNKLWRCPSRPRLSWVDLFFHKAKKQMEDARLAMGTLIQQFHKVLIRTALVFLSEKVRTALIFLAESILTVLIFLTETILTMLVFLTGIALNVLVFLIETIVFTETMSYNTRLFEVPMTLKGVTR